MFRIICIVAFAESLILKKIYEDYSDKVKFIKPVQIVLLLKVWTMQEN